jgi:hypothetical protein
MVTKARPKAPVKRAPRPRRPQRPPVARTLFRLVWRYRWQLAPVVAAEWVLLAGHAWPGQTAAVLAAVSGLATLSARTGRPGTVFKRAWLAVSERVIVSRWALESGLWAVVVLLIDSAPWYATTVAYLALTGDDMARWWRSRKVDRQRHSKSARELRKTWGARVSESADAKAPRSLIGSRVSRLTEPEPGVIVADVMTADGVHAKAATGDDVRLWLERTLRLGLGTVRTETVREDSALIRVTISPKRNLEKVSKRWEGPVVYDDGRVPVGVTDSGREVCLRMFGPDGVRHLVVTGISGGGKSNCADVVLTPLVMNDMSVMFYIDGKNGTSSPARAATYDWAAIRGVETWKAAIRCAHAILNARQDRYGLARRSTFDMHGPDPALEVVIDDAGTVARALGSSREAEMVAEIAERGRSGGVALRILAQRFDAGSLPGGMNTKGNIISTAGNGVYLRPGDATNAQMMEGVLPDGVDLKDLPPGAGWAAITAGGELVAPVCRVLHVADHADLERRLKRFTPRQLTGEDLSVALAAGYGQRYTGAMWLAGIDPKRIVAASASLSTAVDDAVDDAVDELREAVRKARETVQPKPHPATVRAADAREAIVVAVQQSPSGLTRADLEAVTGLGSSAVNNHITKLVSEGVLARGPNRRVLWTGTEIEKSEQTGSA